MSTPDEPSQSEPSSAASNAEASLEEESAGLASCLNGALTFNSSAASQRQSQLRKIRSLRTREEANEEANKRLLTRVVFEVVSTRTLSQFSRKYVAYTVLIKRVPGLDRSPAVIERRYSEFRNLYSGLKRRHPEVMQDTVFPKKTVLGNFKAEVIMNRSKLFEELLLHVYAVERLRISSDFADFLYNRDIKEAHDHLRRAKYDDALPILENAFFLQEKLLGEKHSSVLSTLCEIVASHNAAENIVEAQKFAEVALSRFGKEESHELYIPLLQLSVRLWWTLGKDKKHLERRLQSIKQSGVNVDGQPSLLEIALRRQK